MSYGFRIRNAITPLRSVFLLLFFAFTPQARANSEPGPIIRDLTANERPGVTVWNAAQSVTPAVSVVLSFPLGSAFDPVGKKGLSRLAASLVDEGTKTKNSSAFKTFAADQNLTLQASVDEENFYIKANFLRYNYKAVAHLLNEALTEPRYDPQAVARMKDQIVNVIKASRSDPNSLLKKMNDQAIFRDHPFAHPEMGYIKDVKAVTTADLKKFNRQLLSAPLFVAVAGSLNETETKKFIDLVTRNLKARGAVPVIPAPPAFEKSEKFSLYLQSSQASVGIRKPGPYRTDPDYFAVVALNHILGGGGFGSRFTENLREQKGLTYSINSDLTVEGGKSYWEVYFATPTDKAELALRAVNTEIQKIAETGVTEKELADTKRYLKGVYALEFDRNNKIADLMQALYTLGLSSRYPQERDALIDALSVDAVNRAAKKYFSPDSAQVISVISSDPKIPGFAVQKKDALRF